MSQKRRIRQRFSPRVVLMEDRTLLSTLVVTNLHDSGAGSLRAAVAAADAEPARLSSPLPRG